MSSADAKPVDEREAVEEACLEVGLPLSLRSVVGQLVRTPQDAWPACCGTGCEPCTKSLAAAARRALARLGR